MNLLNIVTMIGSALLLMVYSLLKRNSALKTDVDVLKSNPHAQQDAENVSAADAEVIKKDHDYEEYKRTHPSEFNSDGSGNPG